MVFFGIGRVSRSIEVYEAAYGQDHEKKGKAAGTEFFQSTIVNMMKEVWHEGFVGMRIEPDVKGMNAESDQDTSTRLLPKYIQASLFPQMSRLRAWRQHETDAKTDG
jgi:hypothetical protein